MTLEPPIAHAPSVRAGPRAWSAATRGAVVVILVVSVVARLPMMNGPPLGPHAFRQTQTAITVQAWLDRGFSFFHYETPVLGPPWQVPFECPIYQASGFVFAKLGVPTDLALRLASVLWFHASALLLLVLARRTLGETATVAALAVYTLSPFALQWGRAILIDYTSVTFSLGYLLATLSWAERPRRGVAVLAAVLGALAAATKLTTVAVVVPALLVVAYVALQRARREGIVAGTLVTLAVLAAVPLAVGVAWTRWADTIKAAAPATRWMTTTALTEWNFGSAERRAAPESWGAIFSRFKWITPGLFVLALVPAIGLVTHGRVRGTLRVVAATALAGLLLPISIFFNLYRVHDYYLIAIMPCAAMLFGIGVGELAAARIRWRRPVLALAALIAALTAQGPAHYATLAWKDYREEPLVALAAVVTRVTPPDGWVVIQGDDWSPRIPYLAHRRAFMIRPPEVPVDLVADRPEVATLVCARCAPELLARWPSRERVTAEGGFTVYRVHPAAAQARRLDSPPTIP
jgi:4-amino-4-deoxy-L-arabinose transferase-like glycosyltransferase